MIRCSLGVVAPKHRQRRLVLLVLILCVLAGEVIAGNQSATDRLYGQGDDYVIVLSRLYRLSGVPFPTVAFPVSTAWLYEAAKELKGRAPKDLSPAIEEYAALVMPVSGELRTAFSVAFSPQSYLETSYLRDEITEKLRREKPALSMAVSGATDHGPILYTRVSAIREYGVRHPSNLTPPLPGNPIPYEFNNVYEGYLYWPIGFFSLTFGRQALELGPSPRSSTARAHSGPYLDAFRLTMDLGPIRMSHTISTIDNKEAATDVALPDPPRELYEFDRTQIFFNTHYFEYRFDSWRLGVGANLVVAREMNNFAMSDFFPVFSWHNANVLPRNMSAFVDATVPLARGLEIYGQASFDDIRTTGVGIGDQPIPTIPAFTVGARYSAVSGPQVWDAGLDGGYTHYLWGGYPLQEGLSRALYRLRADGQSYAFPLTSPFGPGTLFLFADVTLTRNHLLLSAAYTLLARKPDADPFATSHAESDRLASQDYAVSHRLEIEAGYAVTGGLTLSARPGLLVQGDSIDGYLDLGATLEYATTAVVGD